jgi:hypothetical protein
MSVIVIGDRTVGKTSMVVALAKGTANVVIAESESLIMRRSNIDTGKIPGTFRKEEETLSVSVNLSGGWRAFQTTWIDTPGEAWSNPTTWRQDNPAAWQDIRTSVSNSKAIFLLLPPCRVMIQPDQLDGDDSNTLEDFPRSSVWCNQLSMWLDFFRRDAPNVQHILISVHKADLCSNISQNERRWRYDPLRTFRWVDYNEQIQRNHFNLANDIIRQHNQKSLVTPRFFITTTKSASLLELPWIYLGAYLANE